MLSSSSHNFVLCSRRSYCHFSTTTTCIRHDAAEAMQFMLYLCDLTSRVSLGFRLV